MNKFSIVIPIYNEEENIIRLIKEIIQHTKDYSNFEIIIVNDGSTDQSLKRINSTFDQSLIKIINNKKNIGQSYSLKEGIIASNYQTIITLDGDGQNNPKDIPRLLEKYFSDDSIYLVGGIRNKRKDTFIKIVSSKIANNIRSFILDDKCKDTGCSLKVFNKLVFLEFPFFDGIHRFLPALFLGYNKKTFFMNVDHRPRIYGYSKYGTYKRLIRGIGDLIRVAKIIKKFKRNCD